MLSNISQWLISDWQSFRNLGHESGQLYDYLWNPSRHLHAELISVTKGTDTYWDADGCKITLSVNSSFVAVLLIILRLKQEHKHV